MRYSLDTSTILDFRRHYPIDVFPAFWERVDEAISSGQLIASSEVLEELKKGGDEVYKWFHDRPQMFVAPVEAVQKRVIDIMTTHPALVKPSMSKSSQGDPFVIAVAMVEGATVVTSEKPGSPDSPKIPTVCTAKGVRCIGLMTMIRELGWVFGA